MDGISPVNSASTADVDVATQAKATIPKPPVATAEAPKVSEEPKPDSLLFFSGLLKTHRTMEREARAAKISSLSIT